jgi:hypothetical protein
LNNKNKKIKIKEDLYKKLKDNIKIAKNLKVSLFFYKKIKIKKKGGGGGNIIILLLLNFYIISL